MAKGKSPRQSKPDLEKGSPPSTPTKKGTNSALRDNALSTPTSTFASTITEDPRSRTSAAASSPQTVVIDVKNSGRSRSAGLLLGMTKPALAIAGLVIMGSAGAAAFGWLKIIPELEAQVTRLEGEVDRLAQENDRFAELNNELNQTVEEFRLLNDDLNSTVVELKDVTGGFNMTNEALIERVSELAAGNDVFAGLNDELDSTTTRLEQEVAFFETAINELILENDNLSDLTDTLDVVTEQLGDITEEQSSTLNGIASVLNEISTENARLEALNSDLLTIVGFLDDTSAGLGNSLDQISGFLADQIVANEVLVVENLESAYRQKFQCWDCDYLDRFREEAFVQDFSVPIADLSKVVAYADNRVLSELCLNADNFDQYLRQLYPDGDVSTDRLFSGLSSYVNEALAFYFPNDIASVGNGEGAGVSLQAWKDASYDCQNLPFQFAK